MPYWWKDSTDERYWVEIRKVPGTGTELWSPIRDKDGGSDPWYDLVHSVKANDVIYHWHAREHRFVGRSRAAADAVVDTANDYYRVPLTSFEPLSAEISLQTIRDLAPQLYKIRDSLLESYGAPLYLPFQFTAEQSSFRFMSNYFTKLPGDMVQLLFGSDGLGTNRTSSGPPEDLALPAGPAESEIHNQESSVARGFLLPFRPKADTRYLTSITGVQAARDRTHEALVNTCASWLESRGLSPACNAAIDLGVVKRRAIIEAKIVRISWASTIREAVGQLYEYRFFKVADPSWRLIVLVNRTVPAHWVDYLERDRQIGAMWPTETGFELSRLASKVLG